ncbi:hypothetical protein ACM01_29325 [Streptomyces viridochromogenes]|uniref:Glycosyl hydrolase family 13 catalytic domain-containing protein n=1 Tax=Streptomyces viridochromogenes TaxID=1938 RepID=A0A0J7Z611_STRVR|nr:alpha-amylase family glycosyl hydrolase [Streptomyces viridochromogenes]KMS70927.1 hypothetical protein ACM01_29325 [Streptomyces viridochromogenes]
MHTSGPPAADSRSVVPQDEPTGWWRDAVIYQIYIRSFADSNGDGIGDLQGIRSRLGYLAGLGVDALWINPFYPSPQVDCGYDVADYRDIDPAYGTLSDFKELLQDAHAHGLRLIIDIVPNHTSSQHPWFTEALAAAPGSEARDRYHFHPGKGEGGNLPPNGWQSAFGGGPAWTRVTDDSGRPGQWYLHLFTPEQPDLNWENPEVRADFEKTLRFWLDLGVDGFRIDVANAMIKAPGYPEMVDGPDPDDGSSPCWDRDDVHHIHRSWRHVLDSYPGERIAVAEAWVPTVQRLAMYLRPDELHQAFNFDYLKAEWSAPQLHRIISDSVTGLGAVGAPATWVLSNHDVVRHLTRFGGGTVGLRRARAAALLMLALPGSAYVYQGDELGLPEVTELPDDARQDPVWLRSGGANPGRDGCRVPLPWAGRNASYGFGPAHSDRSWLPQPTSWADLTVEKQEADPGSMLSLYTQALKLRRGLPRADDGTLEWTDTSAPDSGLLVFRRPGGFICTVNFGPQDIEIERPGDLLLSSSPIDGTSPRPLLRADTTAWWSDERGDTRTQQ